LPEKDPKWGNPRTCYWCRKQKYLMTQEKDAVCSYCDEQPDYIDHMARINRAERLAALYAPYKRANR
jgi:hypothetical protein